MLGGSLHIQLGLVAACIVLFVPMGLAGWHLSRNKMLFFSGALFITLAVGVHLTPYFPFSISAFLSSTTSPVITTLTNRNSNTPSLPNPDSCISYLHDIVFVYHVQQPPENHFSNYDYNNDIIVSWDWVKSSPVLDCEFQKLGRSDASDLLNGSWVIVAGDSQARFFTLSLLSLLLDDMESVRSDLFKRHSNYRIVIDEIGMKFDFIWAPYVTNLTDLVGEFKQNGSYPDVLMMGSGLWHMLHVNDAFDYGVLLRTLRNSVASLLPISTEFGTDGHVIDSVSTRSPHMFWIGMPMLVNSMLNTEEKREKMSNATCNAYVRELYDSKLLCQSGGPLLLLDILQLSRNCGDQCTDDGMHYNSAVYEASVHVMLHALLIESHQKL